MEAEVERAAVAHLVAHGDGFRERLSGSVLDPRIYMFPEVTATVVRAESAGWAQAKALSQVPAYHDSLHMADLARLLGAAMTLAGESECVLPSDIVCRAVDRRWLVAFSPVSITGDSASLLIYTFQRTEPERARNGEVIKGSDLAFRHEYLRLERKQGIWTVVYHRTMES